MLENFLNATNALSRYPISKLQETPKNMRGILFLANTLWSLKYFFDKKTNFSVLFALKFKQLQKFRHTYTTLFL